MRCDFSAEIFQENFDIRPVERQCLSFAARAVARVLGLKVILRHFAANHFSGFGNFYSFGNTFLHILFSDYY